MKKETYRVLHTDKSGLINFEAFPIFGKDGVKDYLDYIEKRYGKWARENAIVKQY